MLNITIQDWAAIVTMVSIGTGGVYFVVKAFKGKQRKYRQLLKGNWTNEGAIGEPLPTHFMQLYLQLMMTMVM